MNSVEIHFYFILGQLVVSETPADRDLRDLASGFTVILTDRYGPDILPALKKNRQVLHRARTLKSTRF